MTRERATLGRLCNVLAAFLLQSQRACRRKRGGVHERHGTVLRLTCVSLAAIASLVGERVSEESPRGATERLVSHFVKSWEAALCPRGSAVRLSPVRASVAPSLPLLPPSLLRLAGAVLAGTHNSAVARAGAFPFLFFSFVFCEGVCVWWRDVRCVGCLVCDAFRRVDLMVSPFALGALQRLSMVHWSGFLAQSFSQTPRCRPLPSRRSVSNASAAPCPCQSFA